MPAKDYYATLEVPKTAADDEIKKAYRKLARKYHPDVNPGDKKAEQKFKEISEAYQVLSDHQKRSQYDQFGGTPSGFGNAAGFDPRTAGFDFNNFQSAEGFGFSTEGGSDGLGDLFETILGGRRGSTRRAHSARTSPSQKNHQQGQDIHYSITLTFEEAFRGTQKEIAINGNTTCPDCNGFGYPPGTPETTCSDCNGTGQKVYSTGPFRMSQTCRNCGGEGKIRSGKCSRCNGIGHIYNTNRISVKIPAGVDDDSKIKITGKGEPGLRGGPSGDLYIITQIASHPFFVRKGSNLYCDVPITIVEASMGTYLEVPTPEGKSSIKIPPGTDSEQTFRLRGKGFYSLKDRGRGDLYVKVKIVTPKNIGKKEKDLLLEFASINKDDPRERIRSY